MSAPGYDSYRESGVEWLGQVPSHWAVRQSRRLFSQRKERARDSDRQLTASQKLGIVYQSDFIRSVGSKVMQVITGADILKHVEPGDFVISMRSFEGGLEYSSISGCISSAYVMLIPGHAVHPPFYKHAFKSSVYVQALQTTTNLVRDGQALRYDNFCQVPLPLPPTKEQRAIAAFLDRETGKIDALVEAQTRLIELLKEKRQAVISHAVTKGLDPAAPMKDSGVEWLGQVPAHWEVKPIKAVASYNDDVLTEATPPDHEIAYVEISDVQAGVGIAGSTAYAFSDAPSRARRRVQCGDIIVSTVRTYLRAIAAVTAPADNMIVSTGFAVIRPRAINTRFIGYALLAEQTINEIIARSVGISYPAINASDLVRIPVSVPPLAEQVAIATFLDRATAKIDALLNAAEEAIALLQERRAALIAAAVTGKIDVRSLAPEQAEAA